MRILSISGGGVWGAGVSHFTKLMAKGIAEPKHYFDGFAGTSTGAIIAACFAHGLTASEVDSLYRDKVRKIFTKESWYKRLIPSVPKYTNREFKKILKDVFGDTRMCDLEKPCWLVAWRVNGENNNKVFDKSDTTYVRDAALASASAPTYFPVYKIGDTEYMDGGLWANNPSLCAICGCEYEADDIKILTLVTGGTQANNKTGNMGLISLAKYLGNKLITGRVTGTDFFVNQLIKDSLTICPTVKDDYGLDDVDSCNSIRRIWELEYSNSNVLLNKFMKDI